MINLTVMQFWAYGKAHNIQNINSQAPKLYGETVIAFHGTLSTNHNKTNLENDKG